MRHGEHGLEGTIPAEIARMENRLLLLNGTFYTMDSAQPSAQAVAVRGSRVVAVGTDAELRGLATAGDWRIIDLQGKAVLPAFTDCHLHFLEYALKASRLAVEEQLPLEGVLSRVQAYVQHAEAGAWVRGSGWGRSSWPPGSLAWRQLLDRDRKSTRLNYSHGYISYAVF